MHTDLCAIPVIYALIITFINPSLSLPHGAQFAPCQLSYECFLLFAYPVFLSSLSTLLVLGIVIHVSSHPAVACISFSQDKTILFLATPLTLRLSLIYAL